MRRALLTVGGFPQVLKVRNQFTAFTRGTTFPPRLLTQMFSALYETSFPIRYLLTSTVIH